MPGFQRDTIYEITKYLHDTLESISIDVAKQWVEYQLAADGVSPREYKVYNSLQLVLQETPAIEICYKDSQNAIFSVGTQEERFNYEILVTTDLINPDFASHYNKIVGKSVFSWLNDFEHRSFKVPDTTYSVYYSEATSIDWGYRRGKGLLTGKINWFAKLLKPNRQSLSLQFP